VFTGERSDPERMYAAMDVYVQASHREGFPRSAMEAAASGLPIVATDIRGNRQVVDDGMNGIRVPVRDVSALVRAMYVLLDDPDERTRLGAAAQVKARASFDQGRPIEISLAAYGATPPRAR
jgi:glycosyltransferase involved in cell wall biosynthesis